MSGLSWSRPKAALQVIASLSLIAVIPFFIGVVAKVSPASTAGLVVATLTIEYSAPVAGLAAGLNPGYTVCTVILVGCGAIGIQYPVFDAMCCRSGRVQGFLDWVRKKYGNSPLIRRYGVLALAPGILTVGFYICPAVSWLFGWDRKISFLIMIAVYSAAATGVLVAGLGIVHWILG
jgi:hypothetical protein